MQAIIWKDIMIYPAKVTIETSENIFVFNFYNLIIKKSLSYMNRLQMVEQQFVYIFKYSHFTLNSSHFTINLSQLATNLDMHHKMFVTAYQHLLLLLSNVDFKNFNGFLCWQ